MARTEGIVAVEEEVVVSGGPVGKANDWGAIIGGALGAIAISIILFTAGSGFGISTVEPWSFANESPETFAIGTGIWLIVMQWLSADFGGYLAGRLRAKWIGVRTDEVLFRDTAHGLLAWALATMIVAALFAIGTAGTTAAVTVDPGTASDAADAAAAVSQRRWKRPPTSRSSRRSRCWWAASSAPWPATLAAITGTRSNARRTETGRDRTGSRQARTRSFASRQKAISGSGR